MDYKSIVWYINRFRAMSPEEIIVRAVVAIRKIFWRKRKHWLAPEPNVPERDFGSFRHPLPEVGKEKIQVLAEARKYLDHQFTLLNTDFVQDDIDWHFDPETGTRSPTTFGPDINYRDRSVAGNVKNIWELNRHQHLTMLAVAYALTKKRKYVHEIEKQLESWVEANPFPMGVNWHSSLELGMRLISWVWIDRLTRETDQHERLFGKKGILWSSIYWHQWFIYHNRSYGSSSNNHLVGELTGLFISAAAWPFFSKSSIWESTARKGLENEVVRQTFPCGLNREMAFSYHLYTSELFLLAALEADRNAPFTSGYLGRVKRMIEVIPRLIDTGGNMPRFGDEDGGRVVHLRPFTSSRLDWIYWLSAHVVGMTITGPEGDMSLAAAITGLPAEIQEHSTNHHVNTGSSAMEDAGIYILTRNRGSKKEVFSVVDAGPLGFLDIAAHGHADALAFTLSIGGIPVIVDAGTYSYFSEQEERDYFRGTGAHNTVTIDKVDQSVSRGRFLWNQKAATRVLTWKNMADGIELCAEHDGYSRLAGKVIHRRKFQMTDREFIIEDNLLGNGKHDIEWRLHFHPDCEVSIVSDICCVVWGIGSLEIELDSSMNWKLLQGEKRGGWYSPGFNMKVPAYSLAGNFQASLPVALKNTITIHHSG